MANDASPKATSDAEIDAIIARVLAQAQARAALAPAKGPRRMSWADLDARLKSGPSAAAEFRARMMEARFVPNDARSYHVNDFLCFPGPRFIEACYLGVLGRGPDLPGYQHCLQYLRAGHRKAELLANILASPEARAYGATVRGLMPHRIAAFLFRIPVLGRLAEIVMSIVYLPDLLRAIRVAEVEDMIRRRHSIDETERALRRLEGEAGHKS